MSSVLDRTVDFLANRLDRRGFLGKSAVIGSAVVAAPLDFALRPGTAYAAVCNCNGSSCQCGSLCCDGYTEFCCTLNGANACPPGTITAGWWKVDGSQFCGGAARYYLDCNAQCGSCDCGSNGVCAGSCSGTGCGCANGSCGNRKAGCTRFRYGQCNQGVRCVGPIVCRVVTCAAPWQFDPACGTSSRTDNATRNHDRPCLNEPFGTFETVTSPAGGKVRLTGWAVANSDYARAGIRVFVGDCFVYHGTAELPRPDVQRIYPAFGPNTGYDVTLDVPPGRHTICVYGVDRRNRREALIGFREVVVGGPSGQINNAVDEGGARIKSQGWAIDPTTPGASPMMRYRIDGREVWRGRGAVDRPDVVNAIPGAPLRCGYSVAFPVSPGRHTLCVDVIDRYGGSTQIGCRTVDIAGRPFGWVENVSNVGGGRVRVRGWVIDPHRGTGPARLTVTVDGATAASLNADLSRPDVAADHPAYGAAHGFDVTVPAAAGNRNVCVNVRHDGSATQLGCSTVAVTA